MVLATTPLVVTALGALVAMGPTTFCAASPLPRVNRSGALSVSVREVLAPGWNASTAGSGLRVTEGWGYMDPNVLHVQRTGAPAGGVTVFGTLFYPCDAAEPSAKWLLYCARIWRSSDGAQSPVLALGGGTSGRVEAYQPPMLFFHNGTLLVANWALTSAGSQVLLSSLSADGDWSGDGGATGWQLQDRYPVAAGASFNYLGGAMSSVTGGITVAGMLELDGPGKSALGVLHASLSRDGSGWKWGAMLHAGPVYSSVDFQPLYPQVTHATDGSVHILAAINSDAPCPTSTRPGHVNMGAMYRQLRYYVGHCSPAAQGNWTFSEAWRDLTPDAAERPLVNGDPCLLYSERFPHDMLADEAGGVLALYRADNQTDANNTLEQYATAWPLLYVKGGAAETRSRDLAGRAFSAVRPETIQAMQITRVGPVGVAAAAVGRVCNSSTCTGTLLITTCSADFRSCLNASSPFEIPMAFGLGGNSVKLTQPLKNGGEDIAGELALWWQGAMSPSSTMNFLRFSAAQVQLP